MWIPFDHVLPNRKLQSFEILRISVGNTFNDMVIDGTSAFEIIDYFVESNFSVKMQMVHDAGPTPSSCFLWIHWFHSQKFIII